jgi:glycosyltransferase involved in cell wall biosynthesis
LHDPEPHSGEGDWRVDLARRLTFPHVERFLLLHAAGKPAFARRFGVPAARIDSALLGPHGLCKEWMQETPAEDERTVLFFGRLSPYKGLPVFYRAAEIVSRRLGGVRFIVAGRPRPDYTPPPPPVLANGASVEVLDRYLHNRETAELFSRATVVACPYVDATQSGVVLTAFAFGKAVVATRIGGLPEYIEDGLTGLLVEPGDAGELADALVRLLEDAELRRRMRAAIEQRVHAQLSWAATAEDLVRCYRRAIGVHAQEQAAAAIRSS